MGIKIERKFLVNKKKLDLTLKDNPKPLTQSYITTDSKEIICVRISDNDAYLLKSDN